MLEFMYTLPLAFVTQALFSLIGASCPNHIQSNDSNDTDCEIGELYQGELFIGNAITFKPANEEQNFRLNYDCLEDDQKLIIRQCYAELRSSSTQVIDVTIVGSKTDRYSKYGGRVFTVTEPPEFEQCE